MADKVNDYGEWIKQNENKWIAGGIITGSIAIITPIIIYFASGSTLSASSFEKLGTVGDFMGGTTVGLLSLTSILFLVSTLVMQRKELGLQREELQLTRDELAKANKQYEITNETMLKQQFETTFFNMINMHVSLVGKLSAYGGKATGLGVIKRFNTDIDNNFKNTQFPNFLYFIIELENDNRENLYKEYIQIENLLNDKLRYQQFEVFNKDLQIFLDGSKLGNKIEMFLFRFNQLLDVSRVQTLDECENNLFYSKFKNGFLLDNKYKENAFNSVLNLYTHVFDNYFNSLNSIVDFIYSANLSERDKRKYLSILCSQLSLNEMVLIKYYIYLGNGKLLEPIFEEFNQLKWKVKLPENLWSYYKQINN